MSKGGARERVSSAAQEVNDAEGRRLVKSPGGVPDLKFLSGNRSMLYACLASSTTSDRRMACPTVKIGQRGNSTARLHGTVPYRTVGGNVRCETTYVASPLSLPSDRPVSLAIDPLTNSRACWRACHRQGHPRSYPTPTIPKWDSRLPNRADLSGENLQYAAKSMSHSICLLPPNRQRQTAIANREEQAAEACNFAARGLSVLGAGQAQQEKQVTRLATLPYKVRVA